MDAQPHPEGDELRARALLRALRVRPFGHQEPAMTTPEPRPITPTRVIPAGAPLPARPPEPGEAPPWRTPPPSPPDPPADPPSGSWPPLNPQPTPPQVVHVIHEIVLGPPAEPEPKPELLWSRAWSAVSALLTWRAALALVAAMVPIPTTGYSAAVTWHYTVTEARAMHQGFGYTLAFGAFTLAVHKLTRGRGGAVCLFFCAVTFIGLFGAMSWYDPVQWLTGVAR